jgi:amino-acid N-acetyltransferase
MTTQARSAEVSYSMVDCSALTEVQAFLASNGLPHIDVGKHIEHFVVARYQGNVIATAAVEFHGRYGLLRSVCVHAGHRQQGLATQVCQLIESHARNLGIRQLYLLTNTAATYFARIGYATCARDSVSHEIQQTEEFRTLCPASAVCMVRCVSGGALHLPAAVLPLRQDVAGARMWAAGLNNTMLTYFEVEPHTRFEMHSHAGEQITSVIEGELFFELDEGAVRVGPGEVMAIPPGISHAVFTGAVGAKAFDAWSPPPSRYQLTGE